jgi:hypothetical protein
MLTTWLPQDVGIWDELLTIKRGLFVEPREAGRDFESVMRTYKECVQGGGGALLFAVCRGKVGRMPLTCGAPRNPDRECPVLCALRRPVRALTSRWGLRGVVVTS